MISQSVQDLPTFLVVLSHELGHVRVGHLLTSPGARSHEEQLEREFVANVEGVKILQEFWGFSELVAVHLYVSFLDRVYRNNRTYLNGHDPCREVAALVETFKVGKPLEGC